MSPADSRLSNHVFIISRSLIRTISAIRDDEVRIEKRDLLPGMYFFQLRTTDKIAAAVKLVVE